MTAMRGSRRSEKVEGLADDEELIFSSWFSEREAAPESMDSVMVDGSSRPVVCTSGLEFDVDDNGGLDLDVWHRSALGEDGLDGASTIIVWSKGTCRATPGSMLSTLIGDWYCPVACSSRFRLDVGDDGGLDLEIWYRSAPGEGGLGVNGSSAVVFGSMGVCTSEVASVTESPVSWKRLEDDGEACG